MAHRDALTESQLVVLRWIANDGPAGVMDGYSHRISAAALRRRGLVTITGRGPTWRARVTAAGREYLKRAASPDPPIPRQVNRSVTQQLVDDVIAAGGALHVRQKQYADRGGVNYYQRAALAERYGKVPDGKRLTVKPASATEERVRRTWRGRRSRLSGRDLAMLRRLGLRERCGGGALPGELLVAHQRAQHRHGDHPARAERRRQ
jgi:hypothetical protein